MNEEADNGPAVVSVRTMEIVTALAIMAFAATVMVSTYELGAGWSSDGPEPGYFPFYIGLIMLVSSAAILVGQWRSRAGKAISEAASETGSEAGGKASVSFVDRHSLSRVLQVLVPTTVYVALIPYIGIYVASALFIALFMLWFGRYPFYIAAAISIAISLALFMTFEVWFLVPLPKGPLELWLGY